MPASAARSQEASLAARQRRTAWLFLAPLLLVLAAVAGWPLLRTIAFSFTDAYLSALASWQFVGLANSLSLAQDQQWWRAVGTTLLFPVLSFALQTLLGLVISLSLTVPLPGSGLSR